MSDHDLPLVSIITPSYNQGAFIRETIETVLNQDYPNIELIVVDGGSTDQTLAILNQYGHFGERFRFISEPDRGQSHAINKGLSMANGEIIGWLNSDDIYQPGAIRKAVEALLKHPHWAMVHGKVYFINEKSQVQQAADYTMPFDHKKLFYGCYICQPSAFIRKNVFQQMGGVDESLQFCMDYDLWIRLSKSHVVGFLPDYLASARIHESSKSVSQWKDVGVPEILKTIQKHYGTPSNTWLKIFINQHRDKGSVWLLNEFKRYSVYGASPRVAGMNRFEDLSAPQQFQISVEAPVHYLLVSGRALPSLSTQLETNKQQCSILVNGVFRGHYVVSDTSFLWEIPIKSDLPNTEITIFSAKSAAVETQPQRFASFYADEVVPLSSEEYQFYQAFNNFPHLIERWLDTTRRPAIPS